jgi:hypothetical protein
MYHPLTNEDGCSSDEERRERATDLVDKLMPYIDQLSDKEQGFVYSMSDEGVTVTVKQLLWLRDIWERFV